MQKIVCTKHSAVRCQQRGVKREVQNLIYYNGDLIYRAPGNAEIIGLSAAKILELRQLGVPAEILERAKNVYHVVGKGGQILTTQHKTRRFRNLT